MSELNNVDDVNRLATQGEESPVEEPMKQRVRDTLDAVEGGASGTVAQGVTGANVGDGVKGSLSSAVVGTLAGSDVEKAEQTKDETLPPVDYDKLAAFARNEDTDTDAATIESAQPDVSPEDEGA